MKVSLKAMTTDALIISSLKRRLMVNNVCKPMNGYGRSRRVQGCCDTEEWHKTLPGKELSPVMRFSLEPVDFSFGVAAVHTHQKQQWQISLEYENIYKFCRLPCASWTYSQLTLQSPCLGAPLLLALKSCHPQRDSTRAESWVQQGSLGRHHYLDDTHSVEMSRGSQKE